MNWLVRKLYVGDRNEPALKGQTAVSINVNNVEESKESCIKIYIFLTFNLLYISFLSHGVYFIYRNCWKENGLRFRQTLNRKDKQYMSFLNELIERSFAVSNACQSWHLWGMSLDFVVNWLKKKSNQYKKYRPISGYSYFISKGAFYLERRKECRGWAISSIFFSCSY